MPRWFLTSRSLRCLSEAEVLQTEHWTSSTASLILACGCDVFECAAFFHAIDGATLEDVAA